MLSSCTEGILWQKHLTTAGVFGACMNEWDSQQIMLSIVDSRSRSRLCSRESNCEMAYTL